MTRKTETGRAVGADAKDASQLEDALCIRTGRHQMCGELAMGGFATRELSRLK